MQLFATLPDPGPAASLDDLVERLRSLKVWAGNPSYETIKDRVNAAWTAQGRPAAELARRTTVADCFQAGRRRMNDDLLIAVVEALHPDTGYVTQWRQALRVIGGEAAAVSQVRVQDTLPPDLAGFTGRADELDRLRPATKAVVIQGMAGVGKTQLAVHAGHRLLRENAYDRVLFVNLRGFHPDPAQPPADPGAVLDGFLRLLGVPAQQIPYGLEARAVAYRDRLAGIRALVVLDNAATTEQIRPLLAEAPGCLTLVTSRRSLAGPGGADHLTVDVFPPAEAVAFLAAALPGTPVGTDPDATARIAERCGHLPLALSLIAGHIRGIPGWTLTDHADRLDERHRDRRLDSGVEHALDLSYRHLPSGRQRLLRLAALHPGQDFDAYAAAALAELDLGTAEAWLDDLSRDHLLQPDRYTFHDLVRAYAIARAHDEDRPAERHAALTRLFDHYLATASAAVNTLHPAEAYRRPCVPPAATPAPSLTGPDAALAWLDTERPNLVAVAAHTATLGWPGHTTRLARTLFRYLEGTHHADALIVHGHAQRAARAVGDPAALAYALSHFGVAHIQTGRPERAAELYEQSLAEFERIDDPVGHASVLLNLAAVAERAGRYPAAGDYVRRSLDLYRLAGDRVGEARVRCSLGYYAGRAACHQQAADQYRRALTLARQTGYRRAEALALRGLGDVHLLMGRYPEAGDHLSRSATLCRQLGLRSAEGCALDSLGLLHIRLGRPDRATEHFERALAIFREAGDPDFEASTLNGLGEAAQHAGRAADALAHHTAAAKTGFPDERARAHLGIGRAHRSLGDPAQAREHFHQALTIYTDLCLPEADEVRAELLAPGHDQR